MLHCARLLCPPAQVSSPALLCRTPSYPSLDCFLLSQRASRQMPGVSETPTSLCSASLHHTHLLKLNPSLAFSKKSSISTQKFSGCSTPFFYFLLLAVWGLRCCAQAFSSCGERGLLFVVVRGLLIVVASLVAEHGL